jgi:hypothetical protein
MKRILCSLLVATLPFGSVLADVPKSKNAKVTLVYRLPARAAERSRVRPSASQAQRMTRSRNVMCSSGPTSSR